MPTEWNISPGFPFILSNRLLQISTYITDTKYFLWSDFFDFQFNFSVVEFFTVLFQRVFRGRVSSLMQVHQRCTLKSIWSKYNTKKRAENAEGKNF